MELVSGTLETNCQDCGRDDMREAVLVNQHGLVLLRGPICVHCDRRRHRSASQESAAA
jgi:hypothetical protein